MQTVPKITFLSDTILIWTKNLTSLSVLYLLFLTISLIKTF